MELIRVLSWIAYFVTLYLVVYWLIFFIEKKHLIDEDAKKEKTISVYPEVSIIVPCYNEEKSINKTLKSLIKSTYPHDKLKIIVIDDGSTDKTGAIVKEFIKINKKSNITYFKQKNKGKGAALNKGLSILKSHFFGCVDADSFVEKDSIKNMISEFCNDDELSIVTPVMKIYEPKNWIQKFQRLEYITSMFIVNILQYVDCNYIAPGPLSIYKTKDIRKVGGFDEESLVEDQEIAYRAQKHHLKIKQCTNAVVTTIAPSNFRSLNDQRNRWFKGSLLNIFKYRSMLFNKEYGDFAYFQLPVNIISFVLVLISIFSFGYYFLKPLFRWLKDLYLIRFDIFPLIKSFELKLNFLQLDVSSIMIIISLLCLTLILLYFSSRMTREKIRKYGIIYIIPYFFIYFMILGFVAFKVMIELLLGVRQKW